MAMMAGSPRIPVLLCAADPISRVGLSATLRSRHEVRLVEEADANGDAVILSVVDRIDDTVVKQLRARQARGQSRLVLVTTELADQDLLTVVELGVRAVALRADATPEALVRLARTAASGDATLPPDLLGRLLTQVSRLQREVLAPRGLSMAVLTEREAEVLRLVAQGLSTGEIAERLCYSQRTIKTILHDIVNRFQLRNRTHAVAYAMREGLI
ncbi:response regulator transcription factor [Planosporangium sp. 12N6]|uniref:response regulator transcription factor n=1 Tax=Planosporangium spinosum TaxID=3402278 RepID=UPI003CF13B0B